MQIQQKLAILANAAKYDVSCSSSGSHRKQSASTLGAPAACGICHTYTEDGRCVSLLKILHTNFCIYNCAYCHNRSGNDIPRATLTTNEIVNLTMEFYRRNYIEGLFLSSGIIKSPDETMERLIRTVKKLRKDGFNGYIHLKCVPHISTELIHQAGQVADRLSINIELPSEKSLVRLTQDKTYASILGPMGMVQEKILETREDRKNLRHVPSFAPAGQSTQLIIGASPESDYDILHLSDSLYRRNALKRVYYSAYVPTGGGASTFLPQIKQPQLVRENRLYQADWLMRWYDFSLDDIVDSRSPFLDLQIDPKLAFARKRPDLFPVDMQTADRALILRVPGIGPRSANRIVSLRKKGRIRFEHLKSLGIAVNRAMPYILCDGHPVNRWSGMSLHAESGGTDLTTVQKSEKKSREQAEKLVFEYDNSFEGLLTVIFEAYAGKSLPKRVVPHETRQLGMFDQRVAIQTDLDKSDRVWKGLSKHLGYQQRRQIYEAYLSNKKGVENAICRLVFDNIPKPSGKKREADLSCRIEVKKLAKSVCREAHRMKGIVRFQQTTGGEYLAFIEPRYDVLPMIRHHFEYRYAHQNWIIYDTARNYGLVYDGQQTRELILDDTQREILHREGNREEKEYQGLWKQYYAAVNIEQRNNPSLHLRQLPRRYWRYLPEKQ